MKYILILCFALSYTPIISQNMSLQDKRIKQNVEQNHIPARQNEMNELTGGNIVLTVDWESFEKGDDWLQMNHQCWGRFLDAMKVVGRDDLGKEALSGIKEIHATHVKVADKKLSYQDGVITIAGDWTGDLRGIFSVPDLTEFLTNKL